MIIESFTEFDDCSFYSQIYLNKDNLNKNNLNENNIFINDNN